MSPAKLETPPRGIALSDTGEHGWRVFATEPLAAGTTIERAPVVSLTASERRELEGTTLGSFAVPWGEDGAAALALGYGALYGTSDDPNAAFTSSAGELTLELMTLRAVEAGEEIVVTGPGGPTSSAVGRGLTVVPPADVRWGMTEGRGRGVFAARAILAGETFEQAPCLTFARNEWKAVENTVLDDYGFLWGDDLEDGALPMGYGAVYNHSFRPNACYVRRLATRTMDFVAIRDIDAGEEIQTNYNRDPLDTSPVWFEVV